MPICPIPKTALHYTAEKYIDRQEGLYHVVPLDLLRQTKSVDFHTATFMPQINGMERIVRKQGAFSPGAIGPVEKPW